MNRIILSIALLCSLAVAAEESVEFSLQNLQGESVSLSDYRGEWVVVNYWATWCKPCRKEIPELAALHEAHADVTVLGIAYEDTDAESITRFLSDYAVTFPILVVDVYEPPKTLEVPKVLPTSLVFSPEGTLHRRFTGPVTRESLEHSIFDIKVGDAAGSTGE